MVDIINRMTMSEQPNLSRVQRVRHELKRRTLDIVRITDLSPHLRAIVLSGPDLAGFVSASFDDHIKVFLDTGAETPVMRDYTPRRYDAAAGELTLEFALHGDGPAARWAASAQVGERVSIGGPRGSFVVPTDYDWHLLVGDLSALPAIARRLEELPPGSRAIVRAHVAEADRRTLASAAEVDLQWVDDAAELTDAVRQLVLPAGEGYAWCAGEAQTMAAVRRILVDDKGHNRHAIRASAYWKHGSVAHHQDLEPAAS
jgi:NADPH-dependent ferric siderophore reductase